MTVPILAAIDWAQIVQLTVSSAIGVEAMVFAMAAIGLNIHFGYTGLLNFGHVGFMAMGGYGVGIAIVTWQLNPYLAILIGVVFALVLALILGVPTLRLRADYLAIVTIAASEVIRIMARSTTLRGLTRGAEGLNEFAGEYYSLSPFKQNLYEWGPFFFTGNNLFIVIIGWILVILLAVMVWQLMRSPWGRVLKAIREDEDAARALGKNAYWYKMQSLMLGGAIGGMAGMLQVIAKSTVQPDTFVPVITFFIWTVLILGGVGRVWSPIVGSMIFWGLLALMENLLRQFVAEGWIPPSLMDSNQVGIFRFILVGLGLIALMTFRPQGIFGSREEMALDAR
ncbi:MAG: branched-chain amino acid ABC transporter permease [Acidimicrobiia bacterium]|nr:branched-chain amino acid ABC transporter permease [Acidimicrobiia bacterium]MDH4308541.1 branched-chain amino acid ABC transporter permease [Acidimicrobiia bacterium]MDH5293230.1 branched-chain amino acid ABC transporter permease [Acidimicrobiia bacterium]